MDKASIIGVGGGVAAILVGNAIEGGRISSLIQPTAAMIVIGGTMGATITGFPLSVFIKACKEMKSVFLGAPASDPKVLIEEITGYALKARKDGIVSLEEVLSQVSHSFLQKALMMAVDGSDSKAMRENLEGILDRMEEEGEKPAKVWEAAGGYSPTIGIIGAVMGLIHVMQNLADVGAVGAGIAVAFVATIYGVGFANLLFLPAAGKLKHFHKEHMAHLSLMMEGALAIQQGQNPNLIKEKLSALAGEEEKPPAKGPK